MTDIFRCESFADVSCMSTTLSKLIASPTASTASDEEIKAFVSAVDAACLRLLKSNSNDANKLFLEATRVELQFFTSANASVQTAISEELYLFYSQIPATVLTTHSPHPQSLTAATATTLATAFSGVVSSKKKDITQPLLHTLSGAALLVARCCPAATKTVIRLLFGLHGSSALISCVYGSVMMFSFRPQIESIFGDCLEALGLEAFLQQAYITVGVPRRNKV